MTTPITREHAADLSVSESTDEKFAAVIDGIAVPYGVALTVDGVTENFAPGAFDPAQVIGTPVTNRHAEVVGVVTGAVNRDDGLAVTVGVVATALGQDVALLARTGAVRGMSVGAVVTRETWTAGRLAVTYLAATLRELALTPFPAYPTAQISAVREETPVPDTITPPAPPVDTPPAPLSAVEREAIMREVEDRIASASSLRDQSVPLERSAHEFFAGAAERRLTRDLAGITVTGGASDITPPPSSVDAIVTFGRPTVAAIGVDPLAEQGMRSEWMVPDVLPVVDIQTGELEPIASRAAKGKTLEAPVQTFAGGDQTSIQELQRASVFDRAVRMALYTEQYARNTNAAVVQMLTAEAAFDVTLPDEWTSQSIADFLGDSSALVVAGTGHTIGAVVLGVRSFFSLALTSGHPFPVAGGTVQGTASLAGLAFDAFGLRFVCDPTLNHGGSMMGGFAIETQSVGIRESAGAPFELNAIQPGTLAYDTALYGYAAMKVINPEGVVMLTPSAEAMKKSNVLNLAQAARKKAEARRAAAKAAAEKAAEKDAA